MNNLVEVLKSSILILFQVDVDLLKKLKGTVKDLVTRGLKVTSTDLEDATRKSLELNPAYLLYVDPDASAGFSISELSHHLLNQSADVTQRRKTISVFSQLVVFQDDSCLLRAGRSFREKLGA